MSDNSSGLFTSGIFISVDVGRSSVKSAYATPKESFVHFFETTSVVANSYSGFANPNNSFMNISLTSEIESVKFLATQNDWNKNLGSEFLFGETSLREGSSNKLQFSESNLFHNYSIAFILYAVGRSCSKHFSKQIANFRPDHDNKLPQVDISLAINLTYTNNQYSDFYSKSLKGKHTLELYTTYRGKRVPYHLTVNIKQLYCFQQGYASLFNFIDPTSKYYSKVASSKGLILDIGRYTVDISLIDHMTLVSGESHNFGTHILLDNLSKLVLSKNIQVSHLDLERALVSGLFERKPIYFHNIRGDIKVDPAKLAQDQGLLSDYYNQLSLILDNFIGNSQIEYVILCGGGSKLVSEDFKKNYKCDFLPVIPRESNCRGMLNLMLQSNRR